MPMPDQSLITCECCSPLPLHCSATDRKHGSLVSLSEMRLRSTRALSFPDDWILAASAQQQQHSDDDGHCGDELLEVEINAPISEPLPPLPDVRAALKRHYREVRYVQNVSYSNAAGSARRSATPQLGGPESSSPYSARE